MAKILRNEVSSDEPKFRVNLNITLNGSKKMTHDEQDDRMHELTVRVLVIGGEAPALNLEGLDVLVDEHASAKEFSTGSVGYGLQLRAATFEEA